VGVFGINLVIRRVQLRHSPVNKFVILFIFTGMLTLLNLFDAPNARLIDFGTKAAQLLLVTAVFFIISSLPLSEQDLKNVLHVWFLVAVVVAAYAVYQLLARLYDWPFAYLTLSNPSTGASGIQTGRRFDFTLGAAQAGRTLETFQYVQVSSFFREPTWLGSYLLSALILFGVLILNHKGHLVLFKPTRLVLTLSNKSRLNLLKLSRLNWLFLGILLVGLLLPVALGPYVSLVITLGLMYILRRFYPQRITKLILLLFVLLFFGGLLLSALGIDFFKVASARISGLFAGVIHGSEVGTSYPVRLERSLAALKVWASYPILGVGLNNTHYYTPAEITLTNNGWARLLSDQGLLGFGAMVLVLWTLLWGLRNSLKAVKLSSWWYFLIIGLSFVLISDIVDTFITFNWTHPVRWFTLAVANLVYIRTRVEFSPGVPEAMNTIGHSSDTSLSRSGQGQTL